MQGLQQPLHPPVQFPPALCDHPPQPEVVPLHRLFQEVQPEGQHDGALEGGPRLGRTERRQPDVDAPVVVVGAPVVAAANDRQLKL